MKNRPCEKPEEGILGTGNSKGKSLEAEKRLEILENIRTCVSLKHSEGMSVRRCDKRGRQEQKSPNILKVM